MEKVGAEQEKKTIEEAIEETKSSNKDDEMIGGFNVLTEEEQKMLEQFDMNMTYGPALGMSRLDRWNRAQKLGLNPPKEIEKLLKTGKAKQDSMWQGQYRSGCIWSLDHPMLNPTQYLEHKPSDQ